MGLRHNGIPRLLGQLGIDENWSQIKPRTNQNSVERISQHI